MSAIPKEQVTLILSKVSAEYGLDEWSYSDQPFDNVAQNYFGVLIPVSLNGKKNGRSVILPLVIKCAPNDERYRVSGAITQFFAKEMYTYSVILKKYEEYQCAFPSLYVIPKCYYICKEYCNEAIVLQNMTDAGYMPYTQEMFLDIDHAIVSLKSLAKFHALSFIMKTKDKKLYEEVSSTCEPITQKINKRFFEILSDRLDKAFQIFQDTEYKSVIQNLQQNYVHYVELCSSAVENTCICHGDMWKENIMFQYKDSKPVSACIIDYQTCRKSSPAYDVLFFIMSSTDAQLRRQYYDKLLDAYYQTLVQTISGAHLHTQAIYPREAFDQDLKAVAPACLVVVNTAMWLSHGLQQEGHVKSKKVFKNAEEKQRAANNYQTVIKNIIDHLYLHNYLCPCIT